MQEYKNFIKYIKENGTFRGDRTGTGTISVFGYQMRFDLRKGHPIVTGKSTHFKSIKHELLWFINGDTNIRYLNDNGVKIWNEWASPNGDLGPVYGKMWRSWPSTPYWSDSGGMQRETIDQISELIEGLKSKPFSRRHIISGWNPELLPKEDSTHEENVEEGRQALPPCHTLFQFYVEEIPEQERDKHGMQYYLSCQLYQRSADAFLGVPFNISSYALLTSMIAREVGMVPKEFIWTGGDCHIYSNHLEQVEEYLERQTHDLPQLYLNPAVEDLFSYTGDDISLVNYIHEPAIKAPISV